MNLVHLAMTGKSMKVALIDDEESWRNIIYGKLGEYFPKDQIEIFTSGDEFLEKQKVYEIVFLDVEMDGKDGFETAREYAVYGSDSIIMILTTHAEMVKRGYVINAFRYLDKLNMEEELREAIPAALKLFEKNKKISIPIVGLGEKLFDLKEIVYIETEKRNVCVHTWKESYISSLGMKEIEELLGMAFFRCHKSYIVNLDMVKEIKRMDLSLKNGETVLLSARKRAELKQKYLNWKYEYANS